MLRYNAVQPGDIKASCVFEEEVLLPRGGFTLGLKALKYSLTFTYHNLRCVEKHPAETDRVPNLICKQVTKQIRIYCNKPRLLHR